MLFLKNYEAVDLKEDHKMFNIKLWIFHSQDKIEPSKIANDKSVRLLVWEE